jgi:hypothetical protein
MNGFYRAKVLKFAPVNERFKSLQNNSSKRLANAGARY